MPIAVENKLKARARKKGLTGKHARAYVYGTMNKFAAANPSRGGLGLLEAIHPRLVELAKKVTFPQGGFALHKIKGPFTGHTSGWFNKHGKLLDAEQHYIPGRVRPVKKGAAVWRHIESEGTIHKEMSSLERLIQFADPRPRNSLGEYTSDPGEGVDPNQMAAAYGPPDVSESHMQRIKDFFLKRRQAAQAT